MNLRGIVHFGVYNVRVVQTHAAIQGILTHPVFSQALGLLTVLLAGLQDALKTVCIKLLNPNCEQMCGTD